MKYKGLKNIKIIIPLNLINHAYIYFHLTFRNRTSIYKGKIVKINNLYYIDLLPFNNDEIFNQLGINGNLYIKDLLGLNREPIGRWPMTNKENLEKVLLALESIHEA